MKTRIVLTQAQREEIDRGRFVRVDLASARLPSLPSVPSVPSVLVGRVAGAWRAYANECRHRALPLDLGARSPMSDDGEYLLCHQHGALYSPIDGRCVLGPCAGEALIPVAIEVVAEDADNAAPRPARRS
jgi:nitrite reductase/ring-hydroxylating ferredoxin subunit